jgi:hypothetical protein
MEGCDRVSILRTLYREFGGVLQGLETEDLEAATTAEARCREQIALLARTPGTGSGDSKEERSLLRTLYHMNGRVLTILASAREEAVRSATLVREERASLEVYRGQATVSGRSGDFVA